MHHEKEHFRSSTHIADLKRLLKSIDRLGDYCTWGKMSASLPVLRVFGMEALSFPVPDRQIEKLIECSSRSPFGKGTENLLDREIRDSWEIDPSEFDLSGAGWNDSFAAILQSCR